ncbi:FG-GAP-like repeat-containing protein [Fodinicola acaciae]|uniref:FG-GAP-like repeat-containing protein n=1 Tax=Fodinicola acaciae TaxID=2681555 RepID=UPI0013D50621|nr:FG-GAP-like repeat-containing protein [Fodinicola acaciae]
MKRLFFRLAVAASAVVLASAALGATPAQAASTRPCDPAGTTASDASIASSLNKSLTGSMKGVMTAYRVSCARVISNRIHQRGLPVRAAHIAITTVIVESLIQNLTYGDLDSLGLFQQRPSAGWGTPEQIMDPIYATNQFVDHMLRISDWRTAPIGEICQKVQGSAFPQRYYDATADGIAIANAVWAVVGSPDGHSVTGDNFTDLLGVKSDGTMLLYPDNILINDVPYGVVKEIGHGWQDMKRLVPADVTGDGYTDLVAFQTDGTMLLYANSYVANDGIPYSGHSEIGHGWNAFDRVLGADVNGDGYTDLLALTPDGVMTMYVNNYKANHAAPYSSHLEIGHGWNSYSRIIAADVTGDGYTDLLGVTSTGDMSLYANNFRGNSAVPYSAHIEIGHGWNAYSRIVAADANGDGYTDLLGIRSTGEMELYPGNYKANHAVPYSAHSEIGHGWNNFTTIV